MSTNLTKRSGYVYIIQEEGSNFFKIGFTQDINIEKRLSSLQVGNPKKLVIRGFFYTASQDTEKILQQLMSDKKVSGEWYELGDRDIKMLLDSTWREKNGIFFDNSDITKTKILSTLGVLSDNITKLQNLFHILLTKDRK